MTTVKSVLYGTTTDGLILPLTSTNDTNLLITQSNIIPSNGSFMLDSLNGDLIQADSVPKAIVSPDGYKGWYYINKKGTLPNLKMNWYFYDGTQHGYTVANIREITATISLRYPSNKPFFVLYTKTGSSRIYETDELMIEGEKVLFYFAETGYIPQNNDQLRLIRLIPTKDNGLVLPEMPVQFLSIHSDSAFITGEFEIVVENLGFRINNITCNYTLETPVSGGGTSSDVNILSSVDLDVVNLSLTNMTFTNGTLGSKLLNVFSPELTNVHIMGQENDLTVDVINTVKVQLTSSDITLPVSISDTVSVSNGALSSMAFTNNYLKVVQATPVITAFQYTVLSWYDYNTDLPITTLPLPVGAYTAKIDMTNINKVIITGSGINHAGSPNIYVQVSNLDGIEFYDTSYSFPIKTLTDFSSLNLVLPVKWMRLTIRDNEVDDIQIKVSCRSY